MKKTFLYVMTAALLAVSCNNAMIEDPVRYGTLSVSIAGEPAVDVVTKGTELSATEAAAYNVSVYNNSACTGNTVYGPKEYSTLSGGILLEAGKYYVKAESCSTAEAEAGNGCRRFEGVSGEVEVAAGLSKGATVNCYVANAKVSVSFHSSVAGKFTNNDLTVTMTRGDRTVPASYSGGTQEFWFNPGDAISYSVSGTSAITGETITKTGTITGSGTSGAIAAKDKIQLNVMAESTNGLLTISASTVTTVEKADDITAGFNPYN